MLSDVGNMCILVSDQLCMLTGLILDHKQGARSKRSPELWIKNLVATRIAKRSVATGGR